MRCHRLVRPGERHVEEEGFIALGHTLKESGRAGAQHVEAFLEFQILRARSRPHEAGKTDTRLLHEFGRHKAVVFDPHIRRHVERGAHAKVFIKTARDRAIGNWLGEIHVAVTIPAVLSRLTASTPGHVHTQMPFTDRRRVIACQLHNATHRRPILFDQWCTVAAEHAAFE